MKILIAGDLVVDKQYCTTKISEEIVDFFNKSEYNILNLEAPITENNLKIIKTGPNLKGNTESTLFILKALKIDLVTLANNHILDYDQQGVLDTIKFCHENSIKTVGAGINKSEASKIYYLDTSQGKIAILNFSENEWSSANNETAGANGMDLIDNIKQITYAKQKARFVFVIVHGGNEFYNLPSPRIQKQYRFYVDNGADLVIGHHPHCISGFEFYKKAPIFYSLGNFLFTKSSNHESWYIGMVLEIEIASTGAINFNLKYVSQSKENHSLSFLEGNEKIKMDEKINKINKIILQEELLEQKWDEFLNKNKEQYLRAFSPINSIKINILKKIIIKLGLEKKFINKSHYLSILNHMRCEAHFDASKGVFEEYLKKRNET
jgi:poly-gamma-glutamate capsule biosynthesis protein CapA/YwtB (metallophosphatase superfamily)